MQAAAAFLLTIGVLVTFHEFGHYWVARRFGVKILRFSIGFGPPFYLRRYGKDATELALCWVPLGGYVRMLDGAEGKVPDTEHHRAFDNRPLWQRASIVAAGPVCNLLLAALVWWGVFMLGETGIRPQVGAVVADSPAYTAGFRVGDEIVSVRNEHTPSWSAVYDALLADLVKGRVAVLQLRDTQENIRDVYMDMSQIDIDALQEGHWFQQLGVHARQPVLPPVIGVLSADGSAQQAGLQTGDRVLQVNGQEVADWQSWVDWVRAHPGQPLTVTVYREGRQQLRLVTPQATRDAHTGEIFGKIGAALYAPAYQEAYADLQVHHAYSPLAALPRAIQETWEKSLLVFDTLMQMVTGRVSVRHIAGPITIADYAGQATQAGMVAFLAFLAIVSVNLGVLNLLPLPPLDGGQLLYCAVEAIRGRPLSADTRAKLAQFGAVTLLLLIVMVLGNDVVRLVSR